MAKIFVLEDDKDIREIVEWILEAEDYDVVSFANVNDFMSRDTAILPDLFLLDVMLPDGSGLDVCNKLRLEDESRDSPIIIMSAHARLDQVANECNADGFIQKPFELDFFLNEIRTQIQA